MTWRVGRKVPRNLYIGDEPIAMLATAELAANLAGSLNDRWEWRDRAEKAEAERDAWKDLAGALRNHESRIMGLLADVNWASDDQVKEALRAIDEIVNGSCPTSDQPKAST